MEWEPISTAPRDGGDILLAGEGEVWIGHWIDREVREHGKVVRITRCWSSNGGVRLIEPTLWCVIPALPGQRAEADG